MTDEVWQKFKSKLQLGSVWIDREGPDENPRPVLRWDLTEVKQALEDLIKDERQDAREELAAVLIADIEGHTRGRKR